MATDYNILEQELTELKRKLSRDLHMNKVRRLSKKQSDLANFVIQRKQIENLTYQLSELEPTVSTVYCPLHALQDNQIEGYLVYLLKMKDFYSREVATKKEIIDEIDSRIEMKSRKLCVAVNQTAKINKNVPYKSPEFVRLENMSDRLYQMNKRICTMRQENKEIMENIMDMRKFQKQFKVFEKDFRRKINYIKDRAHILLEKAVSAYEEKDEFMNKEKLFQERCAQDKRKISINENALNLYLQKSEKNKAFAELQDTQRTDLRIAETTEMIEEGITGLETKVEKMQKLQTDISSKAESDTPEGMEERFKVVGDETDQKLSYLGELLKDINYLECEIEKLKEENRKSFDCMSSADRKLLKELENNKEDADKKLKEADDASKQTEESKSEMNTTLDLVKSLYIKCCPNDTGSIQERPLNDSNVLDYLQDMEKEILDYLICLEYIRMKESSDEEKPLILETEKSEDIDAQSYKSEMSGIDEAKFLLSELEKSEDEIDSEKILTFEELKEKTATALAEVHSEKEDDDTDKDK